ncbi:MAG: hypothetical protein PHS14_08205 [Elusimicrobia bacterium]|nr:hypothetical protein [Elusimicrobiota bacterium]
MTTRDLSLEYGITPADGWKIACRRFHYFARMGDHHLPRKEISVLRPLFLAAKIPARPALASPKPEAKEAPVEQIEGVSLSLVAQKSGIPEGTIKSLLSRNKELQDLPYSTKAAGIRVFFPAFIEWLANHQGKEVAEVARSATSATRIPAGIQLHEMRMIYGPSEAARRLDFIIGFQPKQASLPALDSAASDAEARDGFAALAAIANGLPAEVINKAARASAAAGEAAARREIARFVQDQKQGRLGL